MALNEPMIFFSAPVDTYWSATVVGILHDEAETQGWPDAIACTRRLSIVFVLLRVGFVIR
jgi:hypothetical protein